MSVCRVFALALGVLAVVSTPAAAQPPVTTASVVGTISAHDGVRVPFATLTLTDVRTGRQITRASDAAGLFAFDRVPAGTYDLVIEAAGYAPRVVEGLEVPSGATHHVAITLAVATLSWRSPMHAYRRHGRTGTRRADAHRPR